MRQRELTILVLGRPDRTTEAIEHALAAVRQGGVECDLVSALPAEGPDDEVLNDLVRRCQAALQETYQPILLRVRLSTEDEALVEELIVDAQEDLLAEPVDLVGQELVRQELVACESTRACPCDGFGCVCCMGEACP